jgi:hypothetical protein
MQHLEVAKELRDRDGEVSACGGRERILVAGGLGQSDRVLHAAPGDVKKMGNRAEESITSRNLGDAYNSLNNLGKAIEHLTHGDGRGTCAGVGKRGAMLPGDGRVPV